MIIESYIFNKSLLNRWTIILITILLITQTATIHVNASHEDFQEEATVLKELGLFKGSNSGFELSRYGTRVEAAVIIVRLLGAESFATSINYGHPFVDVPVWADDYIGYLYHEGLTQGISDYEYGSEMKLSPNQFMTFALRSLAYKDSEGDFKWNEAIDKALDINIINSKYSNYLKSDSQIYRDDMVAVLYNLLNHEMNNQNTSLIDFLIGKNVTTKEKAIELGVYKQVEKFTITGTITFIDQVSKAVITDTINDYDYYLIVPFGDSEETYTSVINIQVDEMTYECIITKEAFYTSDKYLQLDLGQTLTVAGQTATNVLDKDQNKGYIIIK